MVDSHKVVFKNKNLRRIQDCPDLKKPNAASLTEIDLSFNLLE
jgi:hypothetical protein